MTRGHVLGQPAIEQAAVGQTGQRVGVGQLARFGVGAAYGAQACLWLARFGFVVQALMIAGSAVCRLQRLPAVAH